MFEKPKFISVWKETKQTANKRLKLQMATMEMDYNLKSLAKLFKLFPHIYKKNQYF